MKKRWQWEALFLNFFTPFSSFFLFIFGQKICFSYILLFGRGKTKEERRNEKYDQKETKEKERDRKGPTLLVMVLAGLFVCGLSKQQGINLRITSGYLSIEEQNDLYAKGRTKSGEIVTNAKGGQSYHNFGLAFDVVQIKDGKALWDNDWATIGEIGKANGLEWGGDWKSFVDRPHFQITFGFSEKELLERYNNGNLEEDYVKLK